MTKLLKNNPGLILIGVVAITMIAITIISLASGNLTETCNFGQGCG